MISGTLIARPSPINKILPLAAAAIADWTHALIEAHGTWLEMASAAAGALFVVVVGKVIAARAVQKKPHVVDLAGEEHK